MGEPKKPDLIVDPNLQVEQAKAQQTLVTQLQNEAQGDTANLMARFGTQLALSGSGMTPLAAPAPPPVRF